MYISWSFLLRDEITNIADCEYQNIALPPNHPILMVRSLVCDEQTKCINRSRPLAYVPLEKSLEWMTGVGYNEVRLQYLNDTSEMYNWTESSLCPGRNASKELKLAIIISQALKKTKPKAN